MEKITGFKTMSFEIIEERNYQTWKHTERLFPRNSLTERTVSVLVGNTSKIPKFINKRRHRPAKPQQLYRTKCSPMLTHRWKLKPEVHLQSLLSWHIGSVLCLGKHARRVLHSRMMHFLCNSTTEIITYLLDSQISFKTVKRIFRWTAWTVGVFFILFYILFYFILI